MAGLPTTKMIAASSSDHDQELIPSDIIFEILTRTPLLKTLDTCKIVSKEWNHLIHHDPSFLSLYCERTNNLFGFFIQDMKRNEYLSQFVSFNDTNNVCMKRLPEKMRILASCNQGLLCCVSRIDRNYRYYVGKAATGQWQPLPNPKLRYRTAAIAIIVLRSGPLRYKIVKVSRPAYLGCISEYNTYKCEIFDSETWTWKETQELKLPCPDLMLDSSTAVSEGNSVYWLTFEGKVVSFNESKQTFDIFSLPIEKKSCCPSMKLVELNGRLGFTCLNENGDMELWMRDNNSRNTNGWCKKMVLDIECVEKILKYPCPIGFYSSEIVLFKGVFEVVFYNVRSRSLSKVELDVGLRYAKDVFHFRSDLERVDLKGVRA